MCKYSEIDGGRITYFNTLSDQYAWYRKLVKQIGNEIATIKSRAEEITKGITGDIEKVKAHNVLLTLGEEGIAIFEKDNAEKRMPTKAIKVADVSGAGDTVISTLTMALTANANILEACYLANFAAGIVCGEVGIVPIEADRLFNTISDDHK